MIKTFKCKETEKIYNGIKSKKIPANISRRAFIKLHNVDVAIDLKDLRIPPSNKLEKLKGNRKEQYSIRINQQYRICFEWLDGDAYNLEIVDYH